MRSNAGVLFVVALALSGATILREIGPHDEGLMLQAAARIADGQLPYRDFWWNYGPGQPLLLAPFDLLLGPSLLPWRVLRVLLDATVAVLAFACVTKAWRGQAPSTAVAHRSARPHAVESTATGIGRRVTELRRGQAPSTSVALLVGLAVAGAMAFPTGPGPNPAALALGLGALLVAPRRVVLAGVLVGLAGVFRLEIGGAAALGVALLGAPRALPVAAATALAGWLPFFVAAPGEVVDQTVGFLGIQDLQRLPFPLDPEGAGADPNKLLELWMPALLVAWLAGWALHAAIHRPPLRALALAPLALAGLAYLLGRTDEFHLVPLAVALPILLGVAAAREPHRAVRAALIAGVALVAVHGLERKAGQLLHPPPLAPVPGVAGDGVRADAVEAAELEAVLDAIGGRTVFVAPPRFDRVTVGDPLLYVLADARNPTRYDVMQPGVVTTAAVQREMVADLERARPAVLVRWLDPRTAPEPNGSGRLTGARLLDAYLARAYGRPERIGTYVVSERVGA